MPTVGVAFEFVRVARRNRLIAETFIDGMPILGPLDSAPDVYVATMHSGMTLAPIVGQYVTRELLTNRPVQMLDPYRPGRFS